MHRWYTPAYEMNQARKGEVRAGPLRVERHRMNRRTQESAKHTFGAVELDLYSF